VSACYRQVQDQSALLVYSSGRLEVDVRSVDDVQNSDCPIFIDDLDSIRFIVTDALNNQFIYNWQFK
jgi:hypothetical protein